MENRKDSAFTGLEAAIVLIAFVVVAAVFSYVMLGAGFFTTQKSQEVIHSGVTQAASNMEVQGDVYGFQDGTNSAINLVRFDVGLAPGGVAIDMNKTSMIWSTNSSVETLSLAEASATAGKWNISDQLNGNQNFLLEGQEKFTIFAHPTSSITPGVIFNLEIKPPVGAAFAIRRTVPAGISGVTMLY
jgi:flagellin FlaB